MPIHDLKRKNPNWCDCRKKQHLLERMREENGDLKCVLVLLSLLVVASALTQYDNGVRCLGYGYHLIEFESPSKCPRLNVLKKAPNNWPNNKVLMKITAYIGRASYRSEADSIQTQTRKKRLESPVMPQKKTDTATTHPTIWANNTCTEFIMPKTKTPIWCNST